MYKNQVFVKMKTELNSYAESVSTKKNLFQPIRLMFIYDSLAR